MNLLLAQKIKVGMHGLAFTDNVLCAQIFKTIGHFIVYIRTRRNIFSPTIGHVAPEIAATFKD
jgi:hypothetical protein